MGSMHGVAVALTLVAWFGSLIALVVLFVLLRRSPRANQGRVEQYRARPRVRTIDRVRAAARWAGWRAETGTADRLPGASREQTAYRRGFSQQQTAYRPGPYSPQAQRGQRLADEPTRRMPNFVDESTRRVPQPGPRYPRPGESYPRPGGSNLRPGESYRGPSGSNARPGGSYPRPGESSPGRRPYDWAPDEERRQQTQQNTSVVRRRPDWQGPPPWAERDQPRPPQGRRGQYNPYDPYER